jgi:hypothetical protein
VHFSVLVRFEGELENAIITISRLLAPYDEAMEVVPYKAYFDKDEIERMAEHFGVEPKPDILLPFLKQWCGEDGGIDEKGLFYWTRDNPKSKWDWYMIGGRWSRMIKVKRGAKGIIGISETYSGGFVDIAYLKDVDFVGTEKGLRKRAGENWDANPKMAKMFSGAKSRKEYVEKFGKFRTFAVLNEDGWYERYEGIPTYGNLIDGETWEKEYRERFLSNFTDRTIVAIVDCHI